jgi:hypothetical protein
VTRRELLVAAGGLLLVAGASILAAPQSRARVPVPGPAAVDKALEDAISVYSAGDDDVVERWMSMAHLSPRVHYTRFEAAMVRPAPWTRARAAFVLEVAVRNGIGESQLSLIGRVMVLGRSTPLGADAAEDRFEILFHHVAIGLLQERMSVKPLDDYVNAVGSRFDEARRRGVALETRIPLARAFTSALVCCWTRSGVLRTFRDLSRSRVTLVDALAQFEEAAREPALRAEALIRGAKLQLDNTEERTPSRGSSGSQTIPIKCLDTCTTGFTRGSLTTSVVRQTRPPPINGRWHWHPDHKRRQSGWRQHCSELGARRNPRKPRRMRARCTSSSRPRNPPRSITAI